MSTPQPARLADPAEHMGAVAAKGGALLRCSSLGPLWRLRSSRLGAEPSLAHSRRSSQPAAAGGPQFVLTVLMLPVRRDRSSGACALGPLPQQVGGVCHVPSVSATLPRPQDRHALRTR